MDLTYAIYRLQCTHPFGISRSTHTYYDVVYVYLEQDGIIGRGEAAPSQRYNETVEKIITELEKPLSLPGEVTDPRDISDVLRQAAGGYHALEAAFSMALLDWWTQKLGQPLCRYFGADPQQTPLTSFTIAIGDLDLIPQKIEEAEPYAILKIKLGTNRDKEIIRAIRNETDKILRVDANEGWDLETAIDMCNWLAGYHVEFVEQPLPADQVEQTARLKKVSPVKIFADENSVVSRQIPEIAYAFHGINIKLMKCGRLEEAKRMIDTARQYDLEIMLGCMVESSIGITAAAHLSSLVDYADLDGNLLINNDPYQGVRIKEGRIILPTKPGLGIDLNETGKQSQGLK
ncbi:MAG: dipeptide epimerase [FCB group bacterium]|nr:dipeptide epimerase [FCB group bacterium]